VWRATGELLYGSTNRGGIWRVPLRGSAAESGAAGTAVVSDPDNAQNVQLSPDERWIAYQASLAGGTVPGVFVEAFPGGGRRQQVADAGTLPRWSADGRSLYYAADNLLSVVTVNEADGALQFGPPRVLMPVIIGRGYSYDVTKDGRILALVTSERRASRPLTLVQGWPGVVKGPANSP
jgi:hypothetical protein